MPGYSQNSRVSSVLLTVCFHASSKSAGKMTYLFFRTAVCPDETKGDVFSVIEQHKPSSKIPNLHRPTLQTCSLADGSNLGS